MRKLIGTKPNAYLFQTGWQVFNEGTTMESRLPTGEIVTTDGDVFPCGVFQAIERGYWTLVAEPDMP